VGCNWRATSVFGEGAFPWKLGHRPLARFKVVASESKTLFWEIVMKKTLVMTSLMVCSSLAFAHGCPGEMKKIDERMPSAKLSPADMSKAKDLRVKGEQLHKDGKHAESMSTLGEAKKLLGI
jgi:hypothetical protein